MLSSALTDGRISGLLEQRRPWWQEHPFGNVSEPPERRVRVAGDGAAVEETRAELTHNGGRSSLGGWRARGVGVGTGGALQCWGFLWAQDAEQVLYIPTKYLSITSK
jgi:hypothetical protein